MSLIEILIVVVIIGILSYFMMKNYFKRTELDEQTKQELSSQGVDVQSKPGMIQGARERVKNYNKETQERLNEYKPPDND